MPGIQDFYSKLSDQEKKFFYATLAVLLLAVFDFLFLQPVSSRLKTLDKDIEQTKTDIRRNVRFLAYQEKIITENGLYKVYETEEKKSEEEIIAAFLKTIENLGREAEVTVGKLTPAESVPKKGYVQYFANVECNGKLENVIKFIHSIDTTKNLLKVVKMNVVGKKSSADEVTVAMKIAKLIVSVKPVAQKGENEASEDVPELSIPVALPAAAGVSEKPGTTGSASGQAGAVLKPGTSGGASTGASVKGPTIQAGAASGSVTETGNAPQGQSTGSAGGGAGGGADGGGDAGGAPGVGGGAAGGGSSGGDAGAGGDGSGGSGAGAGGGSGDGAGGAVGGGSAGEGGETSGGASGGDAGATGTQTGSDAGNAQVDKNNQKTSNQKEQQKKETKKSAALDDISGGGRMQVTGFETLWNNFWGIKPSNKPKKSNKELRPEDYKSEDEVKPNLWERMLEKK